MNNSFEVSIMKNFLWLVFALIIGLFNASSVAAAMLVICPEISQAALIAWVIGAFASGFFIAKRKV